MLKTRLATKMFFIGLTIMGIDAAYTQDYPSRPIRMITSPPGGANNFVARVVAQALGENLGWQVIVDNRPSVGFLQGELLTKSAPDGYTTLVTGGSFTMRPLLEKAPYDVLKDFAPITLIANSPILLVVHPSLPVKSVKELIALAKAKPGALNFSTSGTGSGNHLPAELFKVLAGVDIVRIDYKGAGPALASLVSGEVQLMFATTSSAAPLVQSGRLRAIGVTSAQPSALVPGMPTVAAAVPGYEFVTPFSIFAPAHTPPAVINRLNQAIVKVINQPDVKQKFLDSGTEIIGNTPEQYTAVIKSELATWSKVIKQGGIRIE